MKLKNPFSPCRLADDRREPYLQIFLLSFGILFLSILPIMIFTGGYFIYYGDFNSQQIPFYNLAHNAAQNGAFGWNWHTDLGANFIGSYSFYLLGSPFFWVTLLFPTGAVSYLMPYLLALKHAVAALTGYAFIRRFVRDRQASFIGALLYAYSGFQLFNIFFNHFQDVTAFFPLLLIALEERVNNDRRGLFAVTAGFMAVLNYYFFTGQVVFVLLYFILRCPCKDFHVDLRKFFSIALESVIGVLLAGFMLLPSALAILTNNRVDTRLYGMDMVAYSDRTRVLRIIQSFFMIPDVPARPNLMPTEYAKWASIGGYLPLFSMTGVLSFMASKRKHWATRLTAVCMICAMFPILNSAFYTFNSSYYARWYYMPVLIMAMMTAYVLDNPTIRTKGSVIVCGWVLAGCGVIACLPTKNKEGDTEWFSFPEYPWYFWLVLLLCVMMLVGAALLLRRREKGRPFMNTALWASVVSCVVCTVTVIYFGVGLGIYPSYYVNYAIKGGKEIHLEEEENQFFRVDISENYDNYPMLWGYPSMRCFHSIVPTSVMDFYSAVGITRDVASRAETSSFPLRALFNVKYYFDKVYTDEADTYTYESELPGFEYLEKQNGFYVYENKYYVPMGVAYDYCIDEADLNKTTALTRQKIMLKALGMDFTQMYKYRDVLTEIPETEKYSMDEAEYLATCEKMAGQSCDSFTYDSYGFTATISLDSPKLVFFSVPYEDGWSATVNGKPVDVEKVNYGFMAVLCQAGDNVIQFDYETPGLAYGFRMTISGLLLLAVYLLWANWKFRGMRPKTCRHTHCYDYASVHPMPEHRLYLEYAAHRHDAAEEAPKQPTKE
ncbi:MAG: hypothetical protein E7503_06380 [Ruminococcus sp.]|nr:hypothetical protein [Ruminococcus sp.]